MLIMDRVAVLRATVCSYLCGVCGRGWVDEVWVEIEEELGVGPSATAGFQMLVEDGKTHGSGLYLFTVYIV